MCFRTDCEAAGLSFEAVVHAEYEVMIVLEISCARPSIPASLWDKWISSALWFSAMHVKNEPALDLQSSSVEFTI